MRVVDRKTFLSMPDGTMYAKGLKWAFGNISIKGQTLPSGNDWSYLNPVSIQCDSSDQMFDLFERMLSEGASFPMDEDFGRDDLNKLIAMCEDAKTADKGRGK